MKKPTEQKKKPGAPAKPLNQIKKSMTCCITEDTSDKAIKIYGNRGKAIEAAVMYANEIKLAQKNKVVKN